MRFKKYVVALVTGCLIALGVVAVPTAAHAGGSDSPTPYTVTAAGIQLPTGEVFRDNGHINVKASKNGPVLANVHMESKCIDRTDHECAGARHIAAQYIGKNFIPWEAFYDIKGTKFCIGWVQISGYNEHYGEGGQPPVGPGCEPTPTPQPTVTYGNWTRADFNCETVVGSVVQETRERFTTFYNPDGSEKETVTDTETRDYVVTETDVAGIECRTEIAPVTPALKLATAVCVDDESVFTPATVTLPSVENGVWESTEGDLSGKSFSLDRTQPSIFVFSVTDGTKFRVGEAPVPGEDSYWTAVKEGNRIIFTVTPNRVEDLTDCDLANSGMDAPVLWIAGGAVVLLATGFFLTRRKKVVA